MIVYQEHHRLKPVPLHKMSRFELLSVVTESSLTDGRGR